MSTSDIRINRVVEIFKVLYENTQGGGFRSDRISAKHPTIQDLIKSSLDINEEIESQYYDRTSKKREEIQKQM